MDFQAWFVRGDDWFLATYWKCRSFLVSKETSWSWFGRETLVLWAYCQDLYQNQFLCKEFLLRHLQDLSLAHGLLCVLWIQSFLVLWFQIYALVLWNLQKLVQIQAKMDWYLSCNCWWWNIHQIATLKILGKWVTPILQIISSVHVLAYKPPSETHFRTLKPSNLLFKVIPAI